MVKHEIFNDPHMGRVVRLLEPMTFMVGSQTVVLPAGTCSDGFSSPRWTWWFLDPVNDKRTLEPAIKHDAMYEMHLWTRRQTDRYFRDDLVRHEFPVILAYICWLAVRLAGWLYW